MNVRQKKVNTVQSYSPVHSQQYSWWAKILKPPWNTLGSFWGLVLPIDLSPCKPHLARSRKTSNSRDVSVSSFIAHQVYPVPLASKHMMSCICTCNPNGPCLIGKVEGSTPKTKDKQVPRYIYKTNLVRTVSLAGPSETAVGRAGLNHSHAQKQPDYSSKNQVSNITFPYISIII